MARKKIKQVSSAEEYRKLIGTSVVAEEYTKRPTSKRGTAKKTTGRKKA